MIRIHNFARGVRGIRVSWVCEEMGLGYETVQVSFPPSDDYRRLHPLGSVPFLEDGEVAIDESIAIILYLAQRYGPTPLLPAAGDPAFGRVLQLTVFGEASLTAAMNPLLGARFGAPADDKRNWSVRTQEARVERLLSHLARQLGGARYLAGEELTLADVSVVTALALWRGALGGTMPAPLADYVARIEEREAYRRACAAWS